MCTQLCTVLGEERAFGSQRAPPCIPLPSALLRICTCAHLVAQGFAAHHTMCTRLCKARRKGRAFRVKQSHPGSHCQVHFCESAHVHTLWHKALRPIMLCAHDCAQPVKGGGRLGVKLPHPVSRCQVHFCESAHVHILWHKALSPSRYVHTAVHSSRRGVGTWETSCHTLYPAAKCTSAHLHMCTPCGTRPFSKSCFVYTTVQSSQEVGDSPGKSHLRHPAAKAKMVNVHMCTFGKITHWLEKNNTLLITNAQHFCCFSSRFPPSSTGGFSAKNIGLSATLHMCIHTKIDPFSTSIITSEAMYFTCKFALTLP